MYPNDTKPIRVLIVDDSPVFCSLLRRLLSGDPDIEIIGMASDPMEAKDLIIAHKPDVITLDVEMPLMDGITFLKRLMSQRPTPVVMISSYTHENSLRTLEALDAGAVDFVAKPSPDAQVDLEDLGREVGMKLKAAAQVRMRPLIVPRTQMAEPATPKSTPGTASSAPKRIIAIGGSTGAPKAIQDILTALPAGNYGIVIAQHMPPRFTHTFAKRLDAMLPLDASEAKTGDRVRTGRVLVAPGGCHMEVQRDAKGYSVRIHDGPPVKHQRPSVDVLFRSVAAAAGPNAIGVLLTGMGDDGGEGLLALRQAGAVTIAQDEASSVVFGMPKAAIDLNAAQVVVPLSEIPSVILANLVTES
ncbi:MAG TPA: chemotaxis response regulator protein-glutamate methylesterase [Syntrophobacteraceae bacterium]|nr:chemotaxis response regulator protein-glutamate methylesterase [Syntrophobacteraceae bacterium]